MNKQIETLLLKVRPLVGDDDNNTSLPSLHTPHDIEKFAELIVRECMFVGRRAQIHNQLVDAEIKDHFGVK